MAAKKFDWEKFRKYVNEYDPARHGMNKPETIIKDMVYGLGISYHKKKYSFTNGFKAFSDYLTKLLS